MLPDNLVSVYQQYKKDTNAVASWLASTAKSCGYPPDLLFGGSSQANGPERSKRLKGKARKEAKAAASQAQGSSSSSARPEHIIAIKDFIPLAEFVAASKNPVVSVPLAFAYALNRVIATRSDFSTRLADLGESADVSSDSKHSFFVGVLEKVRQVLGPRFPPVPQHTTSPRTTSDTLDEVGGKFAALNVYEPSEEFLNAPGLERPAPAQKEDVKYVAEPTKELNEAMFAYALLMKDLCQIRIGIRGVWTNYREGALELVAAAIATNTACDLARNLAEDLTPLFEAHGGAKRIATNLYVHHCMKQGFQLNAVVTSDNQLNHETYDLANATCMTSFIFLNSFLGILGPQGGLPLYKENVFGRYDPTLDWDELSNEEKLEQDNILMLETLAELMALVRHVPQYPVNDEFIRGMRELDRTREIPMYLAFAAQIFLDIHHILRGRVYSAHETCKSHMELMGEDLAMHMDFYTKLPVTKSTASEIQMLKELRATIKWAQDDPIHGVKAKILSRQGMLCTAPVHRLLRYSPVISGLLLYHFRARNYLLGLSLANSWGSIVFPLHLWNALTRENLLSSSEDSPHSWKDMSVVLAMLGPHSFYVGSGVPANPEEYMKSIALQLGLSAALFTKGKNERMLNFGSHRSRSKAGVRYIEEDCAPVAMMFADRYVHNTGQIDLTPELVDSIVSRSLFEEDYSEEDGSFMLGQIVDPEKLRARKRNIAAVEKKTRNAARSRMSLDRLIRSLVLALHGESAILTFPYLTLQRTAWGVLRAVQEACDPLIPKRSGPAIQNDRNHMPWVVCQILIALALGNGRPFARAGEAVQDQIRRGEGTKALQRLESLGYRVTSEEDATGTLPPWGTFALFLQGPRPHAG